MDATGLGGTPASPPGPVHAGAPPPGGVCGSLPKSCRDALYVRVSACHHDRAAEGRRRDSLGGSVTVRAVRWNVLLGFGAAGLALSGCTERPLEAAAAQQPAAAPTHAAPSSPHAPVSAAVWRDPAQTLKGDGDTIWVSTGQRTGGLSLDLPSKKTTGTVSVAIQCQGAGSVTVDVGPADSQSITYHEDCSDRPGGSVNDQEPSASGARDQLKVTAAPGVTWAVAVGWSPSPDTP